MNLGDVLFPTDFSDAAARAGLVATEIAREEGVRLHVIHVVPPVTDPGDSPERLERFAAGLGTDVRTETALLSGRVAHQIIGYARDKGIGLIVLGTHGRTGVSRALLGSVAESVVRLASCPVLTVPVRSTEVARPDATVTGAPDPHCIVCMRDSEDLLCETCRTRIRGETLELKRTAERPGHRGSSV
jgi:universal stress protein A